MIIGIAGPASPRALVMMMKAHPVQVMHAHWIYEYALAALKAADAPVNTSAHLRLCGDLSGSAG